MIPFPLYERFKNPLSLTFCTAPSKSTSIHSPSFLYCVFCVTASTRASTPRLRATSTKKILRERRSVTLLFHTPTGVCAIIRAFSSGFNRMFFFTHSTRTVGSFCIFRISFLLKVFSKNCLNGCIIISFSTRGQSSLLHALKLSSRISVCISLRSFSLREESNPTARCRLSL